MKKKEVIMEEDGCFEGEVCGGVKNGSGIYIYTNGDKLEGI